MRGVGIHQDDVVFRILVFLQVNAAITDVDFQLG